MKLSIIIPAHNEEQTIVQVIENTSKIDYGFDFEIIAINDGSTDSTLQKILEAKDRVGKVKFFSYAQNKGKGYAIRFGLEQATGDLFVIQDADLEYDPKQIPRLLKPLVDNQCDVVYGSRFLKNNRRWVIPVHYIGNRILTFIANLLYGCKLTDIETGYKAFTKEVKNNLDLTLDDFGFEVEFTANVCQRRFRIKELPISYKPRFWNEGKKIYWKDGVKAIWYLIKLRFKKM